MAQYNKNSSQFIDRNNNLFDVVMLCDSAGNIINSSSIAANINISSGSLGGYTYMHKFGAVPEMAQNTAGTIWDINNTFYPWLSTAGVIHVECTNISGALSNADNGGYISVNGLDSNYNKISEIINITNSSGIGNLNFLRINDVIFHKPSAQSNTTNITLRINSTIVDRVTINKGRSLASVYTIPAGYTGYLTQGTTTCGAGADATVDMYVRPFGNTFINGHSLEVSGGGGQYNYQFSVPVKIPEKSDIDIRAEVRTNKARITCAYDLILVQN